MGLERTNFNGRFKNCSRREAIAILTTSSVIGSGGCIGNDDEGGNDTTSSGTSDQSGSSNHGDSDNNEGNDETDDDSSSLPDYVVEADEIYQSVEINLEEGILYLSYNEGEFEDGEEPSDLYIEEISNYGLIDDGATRAYDETVELTVFEWPNRDMAAEHFGLGKVEITTRNDDREPLGSIIIDCTPNFEVTSIDVLGDKLDEEEIDEDSILGEDILIELENPDGSPPAPVQVTNLWMEDTRRDSDRLHSADPGGPDSLLKEAADWGTIVLLAEGTNRIYTEGAILQYPPGHQFDCGGQKFNGTLEFNHLIWTDDKLTTEVPVTITRVGDSEDKQCSEFEIELR